MTDEAFIPEQDAEEEEMIYLTDEDGGELAFRVMARMEIRGTNYLVLEDAEDEGSVLIFTAEPDEDGEEILNPVEDEDECQLVFDCFQADFDDYEFCDAE